MSDRPHFDDARASMSARADVPGCVDRAASACRARTSRIGPMIFAFCALSGAVGLVYGTGARTADKAVANSMTKGWSTLASAWGGETVSAARGSVRPSRGLQLSSLDDGDQAGSHLAQGQLAGDETYWLNTHNNALNASSPIALGAQMTFTFPAAGGDPVTAPPAPVTGTDETGTYEVIELKNMLAADAGAQLARLALADDHKNLRGLTLVVCRRIFAGGAAPRVIRFLLTTDRPAEPIAVPSARHLPSAL